MNSPVVVEPSAVAGNDDVVGLLAHVVLAGVHQAIDFSLALLFVILQVRAEREESAGRRRGAAQQPPEHEMRALTFPESTESSSMSSETHQAQLSFKMTPTRRLLKRDSEIRDTHPGQPHSLLSLACSRSLSLNLLE